MKKHSLRIGGRRVVFREAGRGPSVVVLTGLGLSGRFYDRSYDAFAHAGLHLCVPDLPGFGGTRGGWSGQNVAETRAFALEFANAIGIERAIWLGHSIGAQAAIDIAVESPHRAHAISLVGPTGAPGKPRALRQIAALAVEAVRAPFPVVLRVLSDYARTSPLAYAGTWLRYARDTPLAKLRAVQCAAQVVIGTRDPVADAEFVELLIRRLPRGEVARIPGGTHALPRSQAPAFNTAVIQFCHRVLDAPR